MSHRSYELSHPQKRIWYTEMLYPDTAFANLAGSVVFKRQEVDFQLLKKAINWVIERHDALRIRLMSDDNCDIRQYISDYEEKDYETIEGELLENWMAERSSTAFSLMGADLYYFAMIKFSDGRCGYYFKYHHIICDAMTVTLLNKQIYCIYENLVNNEDVVIDTRIPSFTEFLERDKKYPAGETYAEDKAFWQREFIDIPAPVNLCSCVGSMSIRAERRVLNLGEEASAAINGFCRENHTTIFRFFMSVFYIYFLRTSSYSDIVIATGHHNRIAKEERQMAGMTVSTLPIRIKVDTGMNYIELLSCITKKVTDCLSHQQYPFELLASDLRERGSSPEGLLNIMLNHIPSLTEESYTVERYTPGFDPALYNIKINPNQLPKQAPLEIAVDYRRDAFDSAHIEGMFSRLRTLIEDIIVNPGKRLYELEIIPPEERFNLLNEFNSTRRHYPENVCFNDFFAEQVMKTPDNTALVYKDRAYTYRELDSKTNKL
ncbi:MAG: condensation domain-containing protein, partial [Bacillota bacterium]|nr:condensation domain-containing protein [Bacillota bacterium]